MLVGPFEDALFAMQVGEISAPVRTRVRLPRHSHGRGAGRRAATVRSRARRARSRDQTRRAEERVLRSRQRARRRRRSTLTTSWRPSRPTWMLPLKTLHGLPAHRRPEPRSRTAPPSCKPRSRTEIVESGRNSPLVELADDHVLVLRVTAHHLPTVTKPLDEVREQIREELTRERAQAARGGSGARPFSPSVRAGGDPAALATAHGGTWHACRRGSSARTRTCPPRCCRRRSACRSAPPARRMREIIALANGGHAVHRADGSGARRAGHDDAGGARSAPAAARGSSGARRAHGLHRQRARQRDGADPRRDSRTSAVLERRAPTDARLAGNAVNTPWRLARAHPCARASRRCLSRPAPGRVRALGLLAGVGRRGGSCRRC